LKRRIFWVFRQAKIIEFASGQGRRIHPGFGFLAENWKLRFYVQKTNQIYRTAYNILRRFVGK
jgi:pyruvate carboxylase